MQRGNAQATLAAVLIARGVLEGTLFAALAAGAQLAMGPSGPVITVVAVALALTGIGIVLASVLRDARADRQNTAIAVSAIVGAAVFGVVVAPPHPDGLAILTRLVLFGILGEAFVWRNLDIARGLARWNATRNAGFSAIGVIALVALLPGSVDRTGLLIVGLGATIATGVALSLTRSAEELALAGREARGGISRTSASGSAVLVAIVSVVGAVFAPFIGDLLARAGGTLAPVIERVLFSVLLLLGYLAALFVEIFRRLFGERPLPPIKLPLPPVDPAQDEEAIRQIEATRPFVVGAMELVIVAIAIVLVIVLVDRMARERRQALPDGATLDRESTAGEGIGAFLAGLLPRRTRRPRPPIDDGTPAGALRALYWQYLTRALAAGVGWRAVGETPGEHQSRAERQSPAFAAGATLVRAFEALRYGDRVPDRSTLDEARAAVAAIEPQR